MVDDSKLLAEQGIIEQKVKGRSHSRVLYTTYDGSLNGVQKWAKRRKDNFQHFQDEIGEVKEICLEILTNFLKKTRLSTINKNYVSSNNFLSDAYYFEDGCLCHFTLNSLSKYIDQSIKFNSAEKHWLTESMERHRKGNPQPSVLELTKVPINDAYLAEVFKLDHDSFEVLAAKMLYDIRIMSDEKQTLDKRLQRAVRFGETKQLFNVYVDISEKQRDKAQKQRKTALNSIYDPLIKRKNNGEKPSELWHDFIGSIEKDTQNFDQVESHMQNKNNKNSWSISFINETDKPEKIKYDSFTRRLRSKRVTTSHG